MFGHMSRMLLTDASLFHFPLPVTTNAALQVRIYQVKKEDPLGRDLKTANSFDQGKKRKKSKPLSRRKAIV